jgi:hypothetical protein
LAADDAGHRGARLVRDIALVRQAGLAEVHVIVDHTGQEHLAAGVDHLVRGPCAEIPADRLDPLSAYEDVALDDRPAVHDPRVADEEIPGQFNSPVVKDRASRIVVAEDRTRV